MDVGKGERRCLGLLVHVFLRVGFWGWGEGGEGM